ncbi:hypothetical protein IWX48DRAFT_617474 [Phyllosticta citricarpa]
MMQPYTLNVAIAILYLSHPTPCHPIPSDSCASRLHHHPSHHNGARIETKLSQPIVPFKYDRPTVRPPISSSPFALK